jgi:alkanesulfonate monooxygenase SsuD/methylene tetrahydromethanopterin reductase-like flavin-dependent oxidoreductase (luciferase family)
MCAPTREEAEYHASSLRMSRLNLARGIHVGIVSPDEALAHAFTAEELAFLERSVQASIVGDPDQVEAALLEVSGRYATDELGIVTICHEAAARVRSYELVASFGISDRTRSNASTYSSTSL